MEVGSGAYGENPSSLPLRSRNASFATFHSAQKEYFQILQKASAGGPKAEKLILREWVYVEKL